MTLVLRGSLCYYFLKQVSGQLSVIQPKYPRWCINSWLCMVPLSANLTASWFCRSSGLTEKQIPMQYITSGQMHADKCMDKSSLQLITPTRGTGFKKVLLRQLFVRFYWRIMAQLNYNNKGSENPHFASNQKKSP